jgi:OmpA-OmpF porin, OOP family
MLLTKSLFAAFAILFVVPPAIGAEAESRVYALAAGGRAKFRDVRAPEFPPGSTGSLPFAFSSDDDDTAYKVGLGYRANRYVSVEAGYANFGDAFSSADGGRSFTALPGFSFFTELMSRTEVAASSWSLDLVAHYPLAPRLSVLAKVGAHRWRADGRRIVPSVSPFTIIPGVTIGLFTFSNEPFKDRGIDFKWAAGMQYEITPRTSLRAEFERFTNVHNSGIDMVSASVLFRF